MKKIFFVILTVLLTISVACAGVCDSLFVDNRETDKIHPERLNMRAEPSKSGAILGLYYTGAQVEALGVEGDYTQVSIGGVTGYMASEYLITAQEASERYGEDSGFGDCRAAKAELSGLWMASLNVRAEADGQGETVARLSDGDMVQLVGIYGDDWAYIAAQKDGEKVNGYVPLEALIDVAECEAMIVAGGKADTRTILYDAPNDRAGEIMSLKNGTACFSVFGRKEGNWVKVRVGGVTGWIRYTQADNLEMMPSAAQRSTVPYYPLVMQTKSDALLCSVKGDTASPYMTLGQEMKVEVLAECGDAVYVRTMEGGAGVYSSGDYGYMALSDLTLAVSDGGVGVAQADDGDLPVLLCESPEADAQVLGALVAGAQVRIADYTQSDYVQVALGNVTGYVLKSQIRALGDGSAQPSARIPQRASVLEETSLLDQPNGETCAQAAKGSRVYMLAVLGEWAYVQADDQPGFDNGEPTLGFVQLSKLSAPASTTHLTAFVTKDKINIRSAASREGEIVGRARLGERLRVADYGQEWTCVVTPAGKRGYVMTGYLTFE